MPAFFIARAKYYRPVMEKASIWTGTRFGFSLSVSGEGTCGNVSGAGKRLKTSLNHAGSALGRKLHRRAKHNARHYNASVASRAWNTRGESICTKVTGLIVHIICR